MHYYIDGYNLMFRLLEAGEDLQKVRDELIADLGKKIQLLSLDVTLVFDAHHNEEIGRRSHIDALEIYYTDEGEIADDYIINELKASSNPRQEIVITNDNKLAWRARRLQAKSETVDEFIASLNKRYKKKIIAEGVKKDYRITTAKKDPPVIKNTPSTLEDFDYYLAEFEKNAGDSIYISKSEIVESKETDLERWLRIFQQREKNGEEDNTSLD